MFFSGAALLTSIVFAYGAIRTYGFLQSIREYREKTKKDWVEVRSSFLQLPGDASPPPIRFFCINDEVMGGKSSSSLSLSDSKTSLVFSGTINTNGGGFASCRTLGDEVPIGLSDSVSMLLIDVTGDGQLHKVTLHTTDSWSMGTPSWSHDFVAHKQRTTHRLALANFMPSKQGRRVRGVSLERSNVTGLGFGLSVYTADGKPNPNFGDGPFRKCTGFGRSGETSHESKLVSERCLLFELHSCLDAPNGAERHRERHRKFSYVGLLRGGGVAAHRRCSCGGAAYGGRGLQTRRLP